ncbi:transglycosylase SLT domain-containing protein [Amycolatopsis sp. NPDC059027]|uniref:transglycosylase SLT domain-containing protein n=1 Tax=Amycolatopsis sp. NPDC059027 TaxID=3346709 RepID=UPI003672929F
MATYSAGTATVDIVPSLKGFHRTIKRELATVNPTVDVTANIRQATRQIAQLSALSPTIDVNVRVKNATAAAAAATRAVEAAERSLTESRTKSEDAAVHVDIAEKQLSETRSKSNAKSSQIAQAELRLVQARRAAASAVREVETAESKLVQSRNDKRTKDTDLFNVRNMRTAVNDVNALGDSVASVTGFFGGMGSEAASGFSKIAGSASSAAGPIGGVVAAALGIGTITTLGSTAAASLIGLSQAAITAAGAILLIPAGVSVGGAALGTFLIGTTGVTDALEAMSKAQTSAGKDAVDSAKKQRTAAESVASAEISLKRAVEDASESRSQAADRVAQAVQQRERTVAEAARSEVQAERAVLDAERERNKSLDELTKSIQDAEKAQRDLNLQIRGGVLDAKEAALDLKDAQDELTNAQASGADGKALERLSLAYERAKLRVDQTAVSNRDLAEQQTLYATKGVQANTAVASATEAVQRAEQQLADARDAQAYQQIQSQQQIADATRSVTEAQHAADQAGLQAQRSITDAQRALATAQANAAESLNHLSASQEAVNEALGALSPKARAFVEQVMALKPAWDAVKNSVQDALFNGLDQKIRDLSATYLPILKGRLTDIATSANQAAKEIVDLLTDPGNAGAVNHILQVTADIIKQLGKIMGPLIQAFLDLSSVGVEVLRDEVVPAAEQGAQAFADWIRRMKDSGQLKDWMSGAVGVLKDIITFAVTAGKTLFNVVGALNEGVSKSGFYDQIGKMFTDFVNFAASPEGKQFFKDLGQTIGDVATFTAKIFEFLGTVAQVWDFIDQGMRKITGGAEGFFGVLVRIFVAMSTFGLSEAIRALFNIDWPGIWDYFSSGTGELIFRIVTAIGTGGVSELLRAIFAIDWGPIWDWFSSGTGQLVVRVITALLTGGISEIIRGLFQINWGEIWDWFTSGTGQVVLRIVTAITTGGISELLYSLFNLDWGLIIRAFEDGLGKLGKAVKSAIEKIPVLGSLFKMVAGDGFLPPGVIPWAEGHADGGYISGPGTGTSDSIPALLSNGEYVMTAKQTAKYLPILEAMRANRYANGGVVGSVSAASTGPLAITGTADVTGLVAIQETADAAVESLTGLATFITAVMIPTFAELLASNQVTTNGLIYNANALAAQNALLAQQITASWNLIAQNVAASAASQTGTFNYLTSGMASLRAAVQYTADWAVSQWDRMRAAAADPIRWVLQQPMNAGIIAAWNQLNADFALGKAVNPIPIGFATGGYVSGPGTGTSDSIPAMLSNGEFVIPEKITRKARPFLEALRAGQPEALQAAGVPIPRFATGGLVDIHGQQTGAAIAAAVKFARGESGKPYIWGGVGPVGYDCSGYMSAITNVLRGENPYRRLGVAESQPWPGFQSGLGSAFSTGFSSVHTAGTLAGVNVESGGSPSRVKYGVGAVGADSAQFGGHAFLPIVGGRFVSGGAVGSFIDSAALSSQAFANALSDAKSTASRFPGNRAADFAGDIAAQAVTAVQNKATEALSAALNPRGNGAGVEQWRGVVLQALARVGQSAGLADIVLARMNQESTGNPRAINDWDINALNGTPSKGLMQVIDPTFRQYRDASLPDDIWNPLSNLVASMRYALAQYGSLASAYTRAGGYARGGVVPGSGTGDTVPAWLTPGERVLPVSVTRSFDRFVANLTTANHLAESGVSPATAGTSGHTFIVNPAPGMDERALAADTSRRVAFSMRNQ